jgi:hypothetical protein
MTKEQAERFITSIKNSKNPIIKGFNERLKDAMIKKGLKSGTNKAAKNLAKKTGKKVLGAACRKIPLVAGGFFFYDTYTGGFRYAVDELTWPVSEFWDGEDE